MEFGDILIWGGLTIIILRFVIPRLLEWLGVEVTKAPRSDASKSQKQGDD